MQYFYLTGASQGLGKAVAELLLASGHTVIGISRTCSIDHDRYTHHFLDLSSAEDVEAFVFKEHSDASKVALINNAGIIGPVRRIGEMTASEIQQVFAVNLVSTAILCNNFLRAYDESVAERTIINVSSGAANRAIDAWSAYCSSKAGVDMFSKSVFEEQQTTSANPANVFSLYPGLIDTQMQETIRSANQVDFNELESFQAYYENGDLVAADVVAEKVVQVLNYPKQYKQVLLSVKEI